MLNGLQSPVLFLEVWFALEGFLLQFWTLIAVINLLWAIRLIRFCTCLHKLCVTDTAAASTCQTSINCMHLYRSPHTLLLPHTSPATFPCSLESSSPQVESLRSKTLIILVGVCFNGDNAPPFHKTIHFNQISIFYHHLPLSFQI